MRSSLVGLMIAGMVFWAGPAAAQGLAFEIPMPNWDQPYQEQYMDMGPMSVPDYHQQYEEQLRQDRLRQDRLRQDRLRREREHREWMAQLEADQRARRAEADAERRFQQMLEIERERAAIENERNWVDQMRGNRCSGNWGVQNDCK